MAGLKAEVSEGVLLFILERETALPLTPAALRAHRVTACLTVDAHRHDALVRHEITDLTEGALIVARAPSGTTAPSDALLRRVKTITVNLTAGDTAERVEITVSLRFEAVRAALAAARNLTATVLTGRARLSAVFRARAGRRAAEALAEQPFWAARVIDTARLTLGALIAEAPRRTVTVTLTASEPGAAPLLWDAITCPSIDLRAPVSGADAITEFLTLAAPKTCRRAALAKGEAAVTVRALTVAVELAAATGGDAGTALSLTEMAELVYGTLQVALTRGARLWDTEPFAAAATPRGAGHRVITADPLDAEAPFAVSEGPTVLLSITRDRAALAARIAAAPGRAGVILLAGLWRWSAPCSPCSPPSASAPAGSAFPSSATSALVHRAARSVVTPFILARSREGADEEQQHAA